MRDKLLKDIEIKLSMTMDETQREKAMQCVISCLKDYDVSERVTDLTIRHEDLNEPLLKRYVACMRIDGKAEGTVKQYVRTLKKLEDLIRKPYVEMSAYDIRFFLGMLKENGAKSGYIENQRAYISAFFQWMNEEEFTEKNTCAKVKPIKVKQEIRLPFSQVELEAIRNACNRSIDRAIVETFLSSGVRCEELCNLTVGDVDLDKRSVFVRDGKGGKDRVTYISDIAVYYIRKYLSERKHNSVALFSSQKGGGNIKVSSVKDMVARLGKRAKVENTYPHRFRRTFATELYRRGMDIHSISKLMGHSNIETTKRYIYTADEQLQAEYRKFSA